MKKIKLFSSTLSLFLALIVFMSTTTEAGDPSSVSGLSTDYFAPDFRISQITTPGGLCKGYDSRVRVTVTNAGMAGYKQDIPVRLVVSQSGGVTKTYLGKVKGGFAGRDNYGQAVWFDHVQINNYKEVKLHATVNHDKSITETNYGNNDKIAKAKVANACGATAVKTGKRLSVRVFDSPTSSPRKGLYVELRKGSIIRNGNTGNTGTVQINDVPVGSYNLIVKQGTAVLENRSYVMPAYNASLNIILD